MPRGARSLEHCKGVRTYSWAPSGHWRKVPLAKTMSSLKSVVVPQFTEPVVPSRPKLRMLYWDWPLFTLYEKKFDHPSRAGACPMYVGMSSVKELSSIVVPSAV